MVTSDEWGAAGINPRPTTIFVYINDIVQKMTSTVLKFADDTKISSNSQQQNVSSGSGDDEKTSQ